jgi:DNA-binding MarR family transcriptional regulator
MQSECYCSSIRTATRKLTALYDQSLEPVGVNLSQFSMMRRISRAQPVSLTEIGRLCELERSTVGRNVKILERMGLAVTDQGNDHREAVVSLSQAGLQALEEGSPLWDQAQARVETLVGRDVAEGLTRLADAL